MTAVAIAADDKIEAGQVVDLPEWKTKSALTIAVGQAGRIALLKPGGEPGKFVVDSVIR